MAGPNYIGRGDAIPFIVEQRSPEILQQAAATSVAMNTFNKRPVASSQAKLSMLDTFPAAQWLVATPPADVDIAVKPTTEMSWKTVDMYIEELATIVLIPENVLDDSEVNLWAEVKNRCAEAIARLIDQTVFFGTAPNGTPIPSTFPVGGLVGQAIAHNHGYTWGTNNAAEDLAEAWNQTMALVEADGYDVSQSYADRGIRPYFRGMRDKNGGLLYATSMVNSAPVDSVYGVPVNYVTSGIWNKSEALAVMGDAQWAVLGIRQQLTSKNLDQATVNGVNLAEQDMLGLRLKARLGFIILAPKGQGQSATPYPFAVLKPQGAITATGAVAGTPGVFTPAGATPPANLAATTGITATPATAWSTGQYVLLGDASQAHWSGTAWVAGTATMTAATRPKKLPGVRVDLTPSTRTPTSGVSMSSYATVADYELRTGTDVPADLEPTVQQRLDDTSALIDVYLGDCADEVAAAYPDVLTALTVSHVYRVDSVPTGVRSESIGATSVSYDTENVLLGLNPTETTLLDALLDSACGGGQLKGVGQLGVNLGGPDTDDHWAADVDFWVLSGRYRK